MITLRKGDEIAVLPENQLKKFYDSNPGWRDSEYVSHGSAVIQLNLHDEIRSGIKIERGLGGPLGDYVAIYRNESPLHIVRAYGDSIPACLRIIADTLDGKLQGEDITDTVM